MPNRFRTRKHVRFVDFPRHKRRRAVIRLGWQIALRADGAGFWTDHMLEDPDEPDRIRRWVDVTFLGADRFMLWNAEFITTQLAMEDAIHERAVSETSSLLSANESEAEFKWEWKSVPLKRPGHLRAKELVKRPDRCCSQFEGRTFSQECERLEALYRVSDPPVITERFEIDRSYAYGIGLHAVVAETNLDRAVGSNSRPTAPSMASTTSPSSIGSAICCGVRWDDWCASWRSRIPRAARAC